MTLKSQENKVARLHFKRHCRTNRNKLINEAYCRRVMLGRKLHLSVLKGACRCEPWIENGAGAGKREKRCGLFMLIVSPLPLLPLSPLSCSFALTYSYTQKNAHLLFRHSFPSPLFSPPHSFSPTSHKGQRDHQSMRLLIEARMFRSVAVALWIRARMCHWQAKDCHFTSLKSIKVEEK